MIPIASRAEASTEFALAVGRLVQNFGFIEWHTYEWIRVLRRDETAWKNYRGQRLPQRVTAIKGLLDKASLPDAFRAVAHGVWDGVGPLAMVRNMVAAFRQQPREIYLVFFASSRAISGLKPDEHLVLRKQSSIRCDLLYWRSVSVFQVA